MTTEETTTEITTDATTEETTTEITTDATTETTTKNNSGSVEDEYIRVSFSLVGDDSTWLSENECIN